MIKFALFLLAFFISPVFALSLFGQDLQQISRDDMRSAIKKNGAILIKEAGSDGFFDEYKSQNLLPGSSRLYVGYEKQDNKLAFVEYAFDGLSHPHLMPMLAEKYGKPQKIRARYQSDVQYKWQVEGVQILLYQDWSSYKVRLVYSLPQNLSMLRHEYRLSMLKEMGSRRTGSELAY